MATVKKAAYTMPVPADAKIIDKGGKRLVRFKHKGETITVPLTKKGRARVETDCYYVSYKDSDGKWKRVKAYSDKRATEALAVKLETQSAREAEGLELPAEVKELRKRSLSEHLADFRRYLVNKRNTPDYVATTVQRVKAICDGCKWKRLGDLAAGPVGDYLAELRKGGSSITTSNYYLTAVKMFCKWLVREKAIDASPVAYLSKLNAETDIRRERRAIKGDEFARLIQTTRQSTKVFRGLNGEGRAMLYTVAAYTGLRASELASLTVQSLDLESDPPMIDLEAGYSKRRRHDLQPIPKWLADQLAQWVAVMVEESPKGPDTLPMIPRDSKAPTEARRLWPKTRWHRRAAEMLRGDLEASRSEWIGEAATEAERAEREKSTVLAYRDEAGRVFDFHALRGQYITSLAEAGVHPKIAQQLARHSTIDLTMNKYTHLQVADVAGAVDSLPEIRPQGKREAARATGTDDRRVDPPETPLQSPYKISHARGHLGAQRGNTSPQPDSVKESTQPVKREGLGTQGHAKSQVPEVGFEPTRPEGHWILNPSGMGLKPEENAIPDSSCNTLTKSDPDLAEIIASWGGLSEEARAVILRIVRSEAGE